MVFKLVSVITLLLVICWSSTASSRVLSANQPLQKIRHSGRIINGEETKMHEFPFMSAVLIIQDEKFYYSCGGTIINERCILTAAHCIYGFSTEEVAVLVGDHDLRSSTETNATQLLFADQLIIHPGYNYDYYNDVGLIKTKTPIQFSSQVSPVTLASSGTDPTDAEVTAIGWGHTGETEPISDVLQKVVVNVVKREVCEKLYGFQFENILCILRKGYGMCFGDSGGPLLYNKEQVGIVSFGYYNCDTSMPSGSTQVNSFADWINENS